MEPAGNPRFTRTRWSLVAAAGAGGSAGADAALAYLAERYWYPLYAFARRRGAGRAEAEDLVQGFFADLFAKDWLKDADPDRGRFRTFLLAAFRHHAGHEREKARAKKRGGGRTKLSLDFESGENRYRLEPADDRTPESVYERRWALQTLDFALARLRERYAAESRGALLDALTPFLAGGSPAPDTKAVAAALGMTPGAVRVAVHRLRGRYRDALRAEIAETVGDPAAVDEEIRHLMEALAG